MEVTLQCKPSNTVALCALGRGEAVQVERGAMVAMSGGIEVRPGIGGGGVGKALVRKAFGGETFFTGRYVASVDQAWVAVAPPYPGDMSVVDLDGSGGVLIQQGSFVAAADSVTVDVRYTGVRSVLMREGVSMLLLSGVGAAVVGAYGGLLSYRLGPGETLVADSSHLVGFDESVGVRVGLLGGAVAAGVTGEGLVAELTGPGRVWIQTRSEQALGSWLFPDRWQNEKR